MTRTNIDIDDELVERVMAQRGFKTKREAVNFALRRVAWPVMTREEMRALRGTGWDGPTEDDWTHKLGDFSEPAEGASAPLDGLGPE